MKTISAKDDKNQERDRYIKEDIKKGILAGVANVEAGRVKVFNQDYASDLKARLRAKLASNQIKEDYLLINLNNEFYYFF